MLLLTLDLATHCGWSCGAPEDQAFASGVHILPSTGEDIGAFIGAFDDWLSETLCDVSRVVFESPVLPQKTSIVTLRKLYGLAAHLEWRCSQARVDCLEVNVQTLKSFMGVTKLPGDPKKLMIEAVERYGFQPEGHDEADAIAIRLYVLHNFYPHLRSAFSLDLGPLGAAADIG